MLTAIRQDGMVHVLETAGSATAICGQSSSAWDFTTVPKRGVNTYCTDCGALDHVLAAKPRLAEVTTLYEMNLRQVPEMLRALAGEIESGKYGEVGCCAVSMLGDQLTVHAYGPDSTAPSAALVMQAGINYLTAPLMKHGKE